jgi:hypothetical protein
VATAEQVDCKVNYSLTCGGFSFFQEYKEESKQQVSKRREII